MLNLNLHWIDFNCPKCSYQIYTQIIDVKNECVINCHNCKTSIKLKDENANSHKGTRDISKALNKLNNALKNFSK